MNLQTLPSRGEGGVASDGSAADRVNRGTEHATVHNATRQACVSLRVLQVHVRPAEPERSADGRTPGPKTEISLSQRRWGKEVAAGAGAGLPCCLVPIFLARLAERCRLEDLEHLRLRRGPVHVELRDPRILRPREALGGRGEVVCGVAQLDAGPQRCPIRAGFPKGHADAARVDHTHAAYPALKLHVGVAADHDVGVRFLKDRPEPMLWRETGKDLVVVTRRGVAEQDITKA